MKVPLKTPIQLLFEAAGYTYPGNPFAGVQLLLFEVQQAKTWAQNERANYARLLEDVMKAAVAARTTGGRDAVSALANSKIESVTIRAGSVTPEEAEIILAFHILAGSRE